MKKQIYCKIKNIYVKYIGSGSYGDVFLAKSKRDKSEVVIKLLKNFENINNELETLEYINKLSSKNNISDYACRYIEHYGLEPKESLSILRYIYDNMVMTEYTFENWIIKEPIIAIVIEYIEGDTLYDFYIKKHLKVRQEDLDLLNDLIIGINTIHNLGITHQDIKDDNIRFDKKREDIDILIGVEVVLKKDIVMKIYVMIHVVI